MEINLKEWCDIVRSHCAVFECEVLRRRAGRSRGKMRLIKLSDQRGVTFLFPPTLPGGVEMFPGPCWLNESALSSRPRPNTLPKFPLLWAWRMEVHTRRVNRTIEIFLGVCSRISFCWALALVRSLSLKTYHLLPIIFLIFSKLNVPF